MAKPPKCRLAPTVKQTDQESRGELCEIFKFWSFLQSKSVSNVCKLLQFLEDFVPQILYRGFAAGPRWTSVAQNSLGYSPQMKTPGTTALCVCVDVCVSGC